VAEDGYFRMDAKGVVLTSQRKLVRTNCIDCLDRTNVVQTAFARRVLGHQLSLAAKEPFLHSKFVPERRQTQQNFLPEFSDSKLELLYREMWGDNGDQLSMLYAGTRALKRDVTRKGKRTRQGVLDDGMNSAKRYFINNFKDPRYQRALDMILGKDASVSNISRKLKLFRTAAQVSVRKSLRPRRSKVSFEGKIRTFYEKYNPSKLVDLTRILHSYRGRESELLHSLKKKYTIVANDAKRKIGKFVKKKNSHAHKSPDAAAAADPKLKPKPASNTIETHVMFPEIRPTTEKAISLDTKEGGIDSSAEKLDSIDYAFRSILEAIAAEAKDKYE
jgi:hypothetical protein